MAEPARRPARYQDLADLPENIVGEIIGGELFTSPRPGPAHAAAAMGVGATLGPPFHFGDGGPGGWWILPEPEVHFAESVLVPDLAGWRRERLPSLPETSYFELPPDWVCEILSPSTSRHDRTKKLPVYARAGVPHLWLLDPLAHILEVLRLQAGFWVLMAAHGGDETVRAAPFEATAVDLARLWPRS